MQRDLALTSSASTTDTAAARLRIVPQPDTDEYEKFIAEVLAEEGELEDGTATDQRVDTLDEQLLAGGLPVAVPYGDHPPELPDERADVHQAAVLSIEIARLYRYIRHLPPADSKALRLHWGIGCEPHTQVEVAQRMGATPDAVRWMLSRAMRALRVQYGLDLRRPITA